MKKHLFSTSLLAVALAPAMVQAAPAPTVPTVTQDLSSTNSQSLALRQLTDGVQEIAAPGWTGAVGVFAPNAFPIAAGRVGKEGRASVAAAAFAGRARVVAFGHDGYLGADALKVGDTSRLLSNSVNWVSGGQKPAKVGVIAKADDVLQVVKGLGFEAVATTPENLDGFGTLVINGHALKDQDLAPLQAFLARGGGLVIATTGWGWNWETPQLQLKSDFVGNQLLAPYGLVWTNGNADKTTEKGVKVDAISPLTNAAVAVAALKGSKTLSPLESAQVSATLGDLLSGLPANDTLIYPQIKALVSDSNGEFVPFERRPLGTSEPMARLTLTLQSALSKNLSVSEIKADPAGAIFPGDLPPNVKPITLTVSVDTKIPGWHSLGLYAAPGAAISVKLPDGVDPADLTVRIGSHSDTLWHLDSWKRAPEITRTFALKAGETKVANPYGGLVYVVVPDDAAARKVEVTIAGAYAAPLFEQGKTDLSEWKNTIRWAPGPWAEISTGKITLTVPSRSVRDLDDPNPLCDLYNQGMDAAADLYGIPRDRKRPERMVADVQISAGYMHSGYPIMTWLDVEKKTVDVESMKTSFWGHWHEIGHNHQEGDWTFAGTGEVTNNLLPLYMATQLNVPFGKAHPALLPENMAKDWAKYEAGGRKFSDWQSSPFLALGMYIQMQRAFGWEPFKKVFAEYRTLSNSQKPKTEEQKHDQWMVRMSKATGKNMGPFFEKWGVPTSQAARDSIKNLAAWMPEFPTAPAHVAATQLALNPNR